MYRHLKVCAVVPAHNEAVRIASVVASMPPLIDHIVVVDDCSGDETAQQALSAGDPRTTLLQHKTNSGVGAAIRTGYLWAAEQGMDVAVVMAGDGQMDPEDLPSLLEPIAMGKADYVKGNRLVWPGVAEVMPPERLLGNLGLSLLTRATSGYTFIMDSQCGYTALLLSVLPRLNIHEMVPRYGYPNDLLALLHTAGARVEQVPVRPIYFSRTSGLRPFGSILPISKILARSALRRLSREVIRRSAP